MHFMYNVIAECPAMSTSHTLDRSMGSCLRGGLLVGHSRRSGCDRGRIVGGVGAGQRREALVESSPVLGVADAVHDGVVDCVGLGEQRAPDGGQRGDGRRLEHTGVVDDQVRGPGEEPQTDCHQGDLGQFALGAGVGVLRGPQGGDVHLLGLLAHVLLVGGHGLHDEEVRVDDQQERHGVHKD